MRTAVRKMTDEEGKTKGKIEDGSGLKNGSKDKEKEEWQTKKRKKSKELAVGKDYDQKKKEEDK